jgi:hypothetical protein
MKKHFADLRPGQRFIVNNIIMEKIEPVYTKGKGIRKLLRGNCRNVKTGSLVRGHFAMVEAINE